MKSNFAANHGDHVLPVRNVKTTTVDLFESVQDDIYSNYLRQTFHRNGWFETTHRCRFDTTPYNFTYICRMFGVLMVGDFNPVLDMLTRRIKLVTSEAAANATTVVHFQKTSLTSIQHCQECAIRLESHCVYFL